MRARAWTATVLVLLAAAPLLAADAARPTARDIVSLRTLGEVAISPDGRSVAYLVSEPEHDPAAEPKDDDTKGGWTVTTALWLAERGGAAPRRLTWAKGRVSAPAWSPDGRSLAYIRRGAEDGAVATLHVLTLGGGDARPVDTGKLEPTDVAFSPDGRKLAFTAEVAEGEEERRARWRTGGVIRWDREWRPVVLHVIGLEEGATARAVLPQVEVTDAVHVRGPADAGSVVAFAWSPEGTRFAVVLSRSSDPYLTASLVRPAIVSAQDGSVLRWLEEKPGTVGAIAWSPDGRLVAWERAGRGLSLLDTLQVAEADGPGRWNAAARLDPTLAGFVWTGPRRLVAVVKERTRTRLHELAHDGGGARPLGWAERIVTSAPTADRDGGAVAFGSATVRSPDAPTLLDLREGRATVLADLNPQVRDWTPLRDEVVTWKAADGTGVEGLLVTAATSTGRPPLLVMPHGGPDSVTSASFSPWTAFFAAQGFAVLRPNYRGGTGYGFEFYAANRGRLGEIEFGDIESGVDALLAAGRVDPQRLFYGGWSWGGYLTAWTIGHTNRYRAAMAGAAVVDTISQYALSDINHGVAAEWEYRGDPWRGWERFDAANPLRSLAGARTPTLILHGDADDRVSVTASKILYRALADVGCPVEMYLYPGEPHNPREPVHNEHLLETWLQWYRRWDVPVPPPGARGKVARTPTGEPS